MGKKDDGNWYEVWEKTKMYYSFSEQADLFSWGRFLKNCLIPKWDRHGDGEEGVNMEMNMVVWNIMLIKFILSLIRYIFSHNLGQKKCEVKSEAP